MRSRRSPLALLVWCSALACGGAPPPDTGQTSAAIIGGAIDSQDDAVVAIFAHQPNAQMGALCTATVIAPTVLLTAAHCVAPSEVGAGAVFEVITSASINHATTALSVRDTHFDSAFDGNNPQNGHDIGVALLSNPTTVTPYAVNRDPLPASMVGSPVRIVGYGVNTGTGQSGAGVRRAVTTKIDSINDLLVQVGATGEETCNGDSGGPALATVDGVTKIVGVTSYGNMDCTQGGFDTRVDRYSAFIDQYACTPSCSGRQCGDDGCGGSCGSCSSGQSCSSAGMCLSMMASGATQSGQGGGCGCVAVPDGPAKAKGLGLLLLAAVAVLTRRRGPRR